MSANILDEWNKLSVEKQELMRYILRRISCNDSPERAYEFPISGVLNNCNINDLEDLKRTILEITEQRIEFRAPKGRRATTRWIHKASIENEMLLIRMDGDAWPELLELKDSIEKEEDTMEQEFLTVSEFAAAVGVTKQAVYARMNKDLTPFVTVIQGQKHISSEAISLFSSKPSVNEMNNQLSDRNTIAFLMEKLDRKERENAVLQDLILEQGRQITVLQEHIVSQSMELTEIIRRQSQLQENFQVLLRERSEAPADNQAPESSVVNHSSGRSNEQDAVKKLINQVDKAVEPEEKPGFFRRLFKL